MTKDKVEYKRGLVSGLLSGLLIGIVNALISVFIYWYNIESIPGEISEGLYTVGIHTTSLIIPGKIILGFIGGALFGLLFANFYNRYPGSKPILNAIVIALIYWASFSILLNYSFKKTYISVYGINDLSDILLGLVVYLLWGYLFIYIWNKGSKNQET